MEKTERKKLKKGKTICKEAYIRFTVPECIPRLQGIIIRIIKLKKHIKKELMMGFRVAKENCVMQSVEVWYAHVPPFWLFQFGLLVEFIGLVITLTDMQKKLSTGGPCR